jgi:hypothetical protein
VKALLVLMALSLSPEAREFIELTSKLEPVQCEKRKLRREITLSEVEKKDTRELRRRFSARMEKRLAELEPWLSKSPDPEDLPAISRQQVEAFYRCE